MRQYERRYSILARSESQSPKDDQTAIPHAQGVQVASGNLSQSEKHRPKRQLRHGAERKKRLTAAGYDYNEVQKKVNQMI